MIQAEDILMGTKSSRHYAAHTGSWISIIAATSSRQSQLPRGEGPGLSRSCRSREGRRRRSCHSQLLPMFYLWQDTPDQPTIKPFYRRWLQKRNAKWQQLAGRFQRKGDTGVGGDSPWFQVCPCPKCAPVPNVPPVPDALAKAAVPTAPFTHRNVPVHLLQWVWGIQFHMEGNQAGERGGSRKRWHNLEISPQNIFSVQLQPFYFNCPTQVTEEKGYLQGKYRNFNVLQGLRTCFVLICLHLTIYYLHFEVKQI